MIKNIKVNDPDLLYIILETNPYKILGVDEAANIEEINKKYSYLVKEHHPDNFPHLRGQNDFKNIEFIFEKITDAYNLLKNSEERKRYDADHHIIQNKEWDINIRQTQPSRRLSDTLEISTKEIDYELLAIMDQIKKGQEESDRYRANTTLEQAKRFIENHDYNQAINILRQLIDKYPQESEFHSYLGLAMQGIGWNGYAEAEFKVALYYNPKDEIALKHYKTEINEKVEKKNHFFKLK